MKRTVNFKDAYSRVVILASSDKMQVAWGTHTKIEMYYPTGYCTAEIPHPLPVAL